MAASKTVHQLSPSRNSDAAHLLTPHHGVVTVFGYGIKVCVDRGHLILEDGIGPNRQTARLPRVGHGLRRLVIIGSDGLISLAALRWLADQNVSFAMLDRRGAVLATTGPVRPSDARLRRAQALAPQSGVALAIIRQLICQKLAGQEHLARERLGNTIVAELIAKARSAVAQTESVDAIRRLESEGAAAYWSAWHSLPVMFPRSDLRRVPDHWRVFGARRSPLTNSPRLAINPPNAILNYLYALLETEAHLAASALGLDSGLGVLHKDTPTRHSLACDLMEPVRPQVDAFVLDWIAHKPLRREWFFEERNGNCRLMGTFTARLSETAPTWASAVAPVAEHVARMLSSAIPKSTREFAPATRLTQRHKREAKGGPPIPAPKPSPNPPSICRICGMPIDSGRVYCAACGVTASRECLIEIAKRGRVLGHTPEARARQAEKQRRHAAEVRAWKPSDNPDWLTEEFYRENIQPRLAGITVPALASTLGLSQAYAAEIRAGRQLPHPRHWRVLATLARGSSEE